MTRDTLLTTIRDPLRTNISPSVFANFPTLNDYAQALSSIESAIVADLEGALLP